MAPDKPRMQHAHYAKYRQLHELTCILVLSKRGSQTRSDNVKKRHVAFCHRLCSQAPLVKVCMHGQRQPY
eukprot:5831043-Amphidinium_carterae.1